MADKIDDELFKRLVIANQFEILALLNAEESETFRDAAQQLRDFWPLDDVLVFGWMKEHQADPLTREDRRLVQDALEVFAILQDAAVRDVLTGDQAEGVGFPGFSGNEESKELKYFRWLLRNERFEYVEVANPKDLNSHFPMKDAYRRMIEKWTELGKPRSLDAQQASAILMARVHPANQPPAGPAH